MSLTRAQFIARFIRRRYGSSAGNVTPPAPAGPTQDIWITPSSISLPTVGNTATLALVAVDGAGVATGDAAYLYSSDEAHVAVNATTHVATRVAAGGAAVLYGKLVAPVASPLAEPNLDTLVGAEEVYRSTLSELAATNIVDMYDAYGGDAWYDEAGPMRFRPNRKDDFCQLVPRPNGTGVALKMRNVYSSGGDTYGNFDLTPGNVYGTLGPVPNQMACHYFRGHWKFDTADGLPPDGPCRDKGTEGWHPPAQGARVQFALINDGPPVYSRYVVEEGANLHSTSWQDRAPYFNLNLINSGGGWRYVIQARPLSLSPGTVDVRLQSATYTFKDDPGTTDPTHFADGKRIKLINQYGNPSSDAEFLLSNVLPAYDWGGTHTRADVTRCSDILGGAPSFQLYGDGYFNVTQKAVFSESQAGAIANDGWITLSAASPRFFFQISNFDGNRTCDLYNPNVDSNSAGMTSDIIGTEYNRDQDCIYRLWIAPDGAPVGEGILVVDHSQTGLAAGRCTVKDLASMAVNWGIYRWKLVGATTQGPDRSFMFYGTDALPILWTVTGGRGL